MKRIICFIEAKSPGAHIFSKFVLPRLGSILLATTLRNMGYETRVFIEDISEPDWQYIQNADIVCVSNITPTALRGFEIAKMFKNKIIIMGGVHSTFLPEESLDYADYVVMGEGEETIVELINFIFEKKGLIGEIKGLAYKSNGEVVKNLPRELISNLNEWPIPDFDLVHNWDKKVVPLATSRGCPFACRFCSVIQMFGRKYRHKTIERIIEEMKALPAQKQHVFIIDDNFAAKKRRTKELLRAMIANNIKMNWSAQVRTDVAKDVELVQLMAKAGCFAVYIGFESINPKTLELYNKGQKLADIENCIRILKKYSINIHGMFVFGSDMDDIETIRNTQKYASKFKLESIQFMMLTPLPGTPVFEELKEQNRLLHTDWSKYDAHHAVFEPKLMSAAELQVESLKAMSRFYSWPSFVRHLFKRDWFYSAVSIYGMKSTKNALQNSKSYLEEVKKILLQKIEKTGMKKIVSLNPKDNVAYLINETKLSKEEYKFLITVFAKLGLAVIGSGKNQNLEGEPSVLIISFENYSRIRDKSDGEFEDYEAVSIISLRQFVQTVLVLFNKKGARKICKQAFKKSGLKLEESNIKLLIPKIKTA